MTTLPRSKHEPLARACAELNGDRFTESTKEIKTRGPNGRWIFLTVNQYISCKNLAGRVFDILKETEAIKKDHVSTDCICWICDFPKEAFDDTPQALWNIMKAAGLLGDTE